MQLFLFVSCCCVFLWRQDVAKAARRRKKGESTSTLQQARTSKAKARVFRGKTTPPPRGHFGRNPSRRIGIGEGGETASDRGRNRLVGWLGWAGPAWEVIWGLSTEPLLAEVADVAEVSGQASPSPARGGQKKKPDWKGKKKRIGGR